MTDHEQRVRELIAQGKKIDAIKLLREATGIGLAEAKSAVELLERSGSLPPTRPTASPNIPLEVADLARRGKTVEAIKLLRERRGLSLQDAKQQVDRLPVDPVARRSGCLGGVLILVALTSALL